MHRFKIKKKKVGGQLIKLDEVIHRAFYNGARRPDVGAARGILRGIPGFA